ncbi:DUF3500 domain-containing protein [Deinococcus sp. YIM 134068]|uniref:DUF3500 domain-containing protein n=1 Tax=Deinococcus lichenicola TaxID=3118910 RepID=UPI002F931341
MRFPLKLWIGAALTLPLALLAHGAAGGGGAPSASASCTQSDTTARVVCAADAFMATLSASQRETLLEDYSATNAVKWSNLPCGSNCRVGVQLSDLTAAQRAAAEAVVAAATGRTANEGFDEVRQIRAADDVLGAAQASGEGGGPGAGGPPSGPPPGGDPNGGPPPGAPEGGPPAGGPGGGPGGGLSGYDADFYFIAFLGTPSTTGTWQLQFGGHHLAVNVTFKGGRVAGSTPEFVGVEPRTWTTGGRTYAPLNQERGGMRALLASLSATQRERARLSPRFSDVLLGPGKDGQFPQEEQGLPVSALNEGQRALVLAAIAPWVRDASGDAAARLLATYRAELDRTYVAYSGTTALNANADYVRISGPHVWIEFVCQNGVVYADQIHYHTIWRDKESDYGGSFFY